MKFVSTFLVVVFYSIIKPSESFWSLNMENQFGYEMHDRSVMAMEILDAIFLSTTRPQTVQTDEKTKNGLSAMNFYKTNLQPCKVFYDELKTAASSRGMNENYYFSRISSSSIDCNKSLGTIINSTSQFVNLNTITGPLITSNINDALSKIKLQLPNATISSESITKSIYRLRNSTSLLTPDLLNNFIDLETVNQMRKFFNVTVKSFHQVLENVNDAARLVFAHGSIYNILYSSSINGERSKNDSLLRYINTYNNHQSNILNNMKSTQPTIQSGYNSFIQSVRNAYSDDIVRPKFEQDQLPIIYNYTNIISNYIFNYNEMNVSFMEHRNKIVGIYAQYLSNEPTMQFIDYMEKIMNLLRKSYLRNYGTQIDTLVSKAQMEMAVFSNGYPFCLDERTASSNIIFPGIQSWLNNMKDRINAVLNELKACISTQMTIEARKSTSKCIQIQVNNMYSNFDIMKNMMEVNLDPLGENAVQSFTKCMSNICSSYVAYFDA